MDAALTGQLIAARRKEKGLSQTELAERLHVTDKAVSRWETGRGMPGIDSLEPLAEALDLTVSELLAGRPLTAEELPKAAGGQIVEQMRAGARGLRRGILAALLAVALAAGLYVSYFYFTSIPATDQTSLAREAGRYLSQWEDVTGESDWNGIRVVETEQRGDYLAALCTNSRGEWCMCVYDRDRIFQDRWRGGGGKHTLKPGALGSWNFGNPREAVIIFCGGDLPEEAAYYTFQNSGITYTCPIENGRVLDVFLLPDTNDISSYPEQLLDQDGQPLLETDSESAATYVP